MDFRRSNRHFQLSSDPRQQQVSAAIEQPIQPDSNDNSAPQTLGSQQPQQFTPSVEQPQAPAQVAQQQTSQPQPQVVPEQTAPTEEPELSEISFVPPPPEVPVSQPPVIESMKVTPEPEVPAIDEAPVAQPVVAVPKVQKDGKNVPLKFVVSGGFVTLLLLVGSIVIQQMAISELKMERRVLGEQVKLVNPISVGAGATKNQDANTAEDLDQTSETTQTE